MFEKRKLLIKKAYEKAKKELKKEKDSVSTILAFVSSELEQEFGFAKDERSFVRYYKRLIHENRDYDIDEITLDQLSWYIGYKDFFDFCENILIEKDKDETSIQLKIDEDEDSISEKLSKIIINIKNTPIFNIPQMARNGMGVGALLLILIAGLAYKGMFKKNECMYWDGNEYKLTSCDDKNPKHYLIPIDTVRFKYFKKITRPDTLTIDNALRKSWYSKSDNVVEFFTMDGINPDNGKELDITSKHMLTKYAGDSAKKKW